MPTSKETFYAQMDDLADAINAKAGTTGSKTVVQMKSAVESIVVSVNKLPDIVQGDEYVDITADDLAGATKIWGSCFTNYEKLRSLTLPNSITTIGSRAFSGCNSMTEVIIGSGITSIGDYAFMNCNVLRSITIHAITPPTLASAVFDNINYNAVIYVPAQSVNAYKTATNWSSYASKIQAIPE